MEGGEQATKLDNGGGSSPDGEVPVPAPDNGVDDAKKDTVDAMAGLRRRVVELEAEVKSEWDEMAGLRGRLVELEKEVEESEAAKKALASHASYLEGEVSRLQHDLLTAQSAVADSEADAESARLSGQKLAQSKVQIETRLDLLQAGIKKKEEEVLALEREVAGLKSSEEKGNEAFKKKIEELEEALKEMEDRNSQLETKLAASAPKDLSLNGISDMNGDLVEKKESPTVSLAVAAAVAASTGAVAVAATTLYLRHARR